MPKDTPQNEELRLKRINTWIAGFGIVAAILSFWFGFRQLAAQARLQTEAIEQQWSNKFYDEKLTLYTRATESAAEISALKALGAPEKKVQKAIVEFRTLFWGPMCITEGREVERAMVLFGRGLDSGLPATDLQQLCLYLARTCKAEARALYEPKDVADAPKETNQEMLDRVTKILELHEQKLKAEPNVGLEGLQP